MTRRFAAGIDLHGTLLDESWRVPDHLADGLKVALGSLRPLCEMFLCTGNDLSFVHERIGPEISSLFDGFVLETGCVVSRGSEEEVLVPPSVQTFMKELEDRLQEASFPGMQYFARRLATISMFTKTEQGGADPTGLHPKVEEEVRRMGYGNRVLVTHSDVAVDIIPGGFNKFTGLRRASNAPILIGIADSYNDLHLIRDAELAFLPANASPSLLAELERRGQVVEPLSQCPMTSGRTTAISEHRHTEAVTEILQFLSRHLGHYLQ